MNILSKFKNGIEKSSNYLSSNFQKILLGNKINNETLEELESILISADLGYEDNGKSKAFLEMNAIAKSLEWCTGTYKWGLASPLTTPPSDLPKC